MARSAANSTLSTLGAALAWLATKTATRGALLAVVGLAGVVLVRAPATIEGSSLLALDGTAAGDADSTPDGADDRPAPIEVDSTSDGLLAAPPGRVRAAAGDNSESAESINSALPTDPDAEIPLSVGRRVLSSSCGCRERPFDPVEDALRWLMAHQSLDGGWACEGWRTWCNQKEHPEGDHLEGAGRASYDVGVTGLALLAFLGAGYTNRSEGPFGKVVGNGMKYLRNAQDAEGCFGDRTSSRFMHNHAIAALAMLEVYGMTWSSIYRGPAQRALEFGAAARNLSSGWRYGVRSGESDSALTGWMLMAFESAKRNNAFEVKSGREPSLALDDTVFEGAAAWFEHMTDAGSGRVGYTRRGAGPFRPSEAARRFPARQSEAMTALGMLTRMFLGEAKETSEAIGRGVELCSELVPLWAPDDGSIDFTYWYFGTLALFQVGGEPWRKWEAAMKTAIVDTQRRDGEHCQLKGSWDAIDAWSDEGGRVYATAMMALCLEVWYRYDKVFGAK